MCPGKRDLETQYYPGSVGKTLPSVVSVLWPASWALASTPYLKRSNRDCLVAGRAEALAKKPFMEGSTLPFMRNSWGRLGQ